MRVHYHRERGGGVRVVSVGTSSQCKEGYFKLDPDRAGRMDHHLFRIGYLYLVKVVEHRQCQLNCCACAKVATAMMKTPRPENGPVYPLKSAGAQQAQWSI
jgi:hypothetical protein